MLLIIAGMRRSGSTLSYQIACELAGERSGIRRVEKLPRNVENRPTWHVVKTHSYLPKMLDKMDTGKVQVITTVRDPRDVTVSIMTLKSNNTFDLAKGMVSSAIKKQSLWERNVQSGLHICRYEAFYNDLNSFIITIALTMNKQVSQEKIERIAETFSFENNKVRSEELGKTDTDFLFPGHVQDGLVGKWRTELDTEQINLIQDIAGWEWMQNHSYSWYISTGEMR